MHFHKTPWKKSRTYGDIYGGRTHRKFTDRIAWRRHSLEQPSPDDTLPIILEDNPSRDFFFPLSANEVITALEKLPEYVSEDITHVWLRRRDQAVNQKGCNPFATFICGSGVKLITIYPWPRNLEYVLGPKKPCRSCEKEHRAHGAEVKRKGRVWTSKWTLDAVRDYYIQNLLYHCIGYCLDRYYRYESAANGKESEDFARQFAIAYSPQGIEVFEELSENASIIPENL